MARTGNGGGHVQRDPPHAGRTPNLQLVSKWESISNPNKFLVIFGAEKQGTSSASPGTLFVGHQWLLMAGHHRRILSCITKIDPTFVAIGRSGSHAI